MTKYVHLYITANKYFNSLSQEGFPPKMFGYVKHTTLSHVAIRNALHIMEPVFGSIRYAYPDLPQPLLISTFFVPADFQILRSLLPKVAFPNAFLTLSFHYTIGVFQGCSLSPSCSLSPTSVFSHCFQLIINICFQPLLNIVSAISISNEWSYRLSPIQPYLQLFRLCWQHWAALMISSDKSKWIYAIDTSLGLVLWLPIQTNALPQLCSNPTMQVRWDSSDLFASNQNCP